MSASWSDQTQVVASTRPPKHMPNNQKINYIGHVMERNTQAPIGAAKVSLDFQGIPLVVYTDAEGIYRFTVDLIGSNTVVGQVWVDANGYRRYNRHIELSPDKTDVGYFQLEKTDQDHFWSRIRTPIYVVIIGAFATITVAFIAKSVFLPTIKSPIEPSPSTTSTRNNSGNSNNADYYMKQGAERSSSGNWQGAIESYTKAIYLAPNNPDAYMSRGAAYSNLENWNKAVEDYTKAIALAPNNFNAYMSRGAAYSNLEDKQRADSDYKKAADLEQK